MQVFERVGPRLRCELICRRTLLQTVNRYAGNLRERAKPGNRTHPVVVVLVGQLTRPHQADFEMRVGSQARLPAQKQPRLGLKIGRRVRECFPRRAHDERQTHEWRMHIKIGGDGKIGRAFHQYIDIAALF